MLVRCAGIEKGGGLTAYLGDAIGYLHIENLYRPEAQTILLFKECYALEKIHGTSAHVGWNGKEVHFFPGGEKYDNFIKLFSPEEMAARLAVSFGEAEAKIYGEAYGGKCQGMSDTYGKALKFVAFDVRVNDLWLEVPKAEAVVTSLGLEFVHYAKVPTDLAILDAERDKPSTQAKRNGILEDKKSEGVVLRPLVEWRKNNGERVIAKHKRKDFAERKNVPVVDADKLVVLEAAGAIADEWVTDMRLTHVLDKLGNPTDITAIGKVIQAMVEDVLREASGEIVDSKEARKAIGTRAAQLYKNRINTIPNA